MAANGVFGRNDRLTEILSVRVCRRWLLQRGTALGLGMPAMSALLTACASSVTTPTGGSSTTPTVTIPAASNVTPTSTPQAKKTSIGPVGQITIGRASDVLTLDPSRDTSPISLDVFKSIYSQLTDIRADASVGPLLAATWESSEDAVTWDFTLADGVLFHNGDPVTVDDVLWTYQMIMASENSPVKAYTVAIDKIEKVNDKTIRFILKYPYSPFPRQASLISIMPRKVYESVGPEQFTLQPVGSGPFKLVEWVKDDHLTVEAYEGYFLGAPAVKTVIFRPIPSEDARVAALEAGEVDIVALLPPPSLERLKLISGLRVELIESNRNLYIGINTTIPPLDSLQLRQAMDMAIDRDAICRDLLSGLGKPIGQPVAPVTFGYDPTIEPTPYDPEHARKLVAESGYSGEEILFQYPINRYQFGNEVAQAVASYLEEIGIRIKLEGMEYSAFFPLWQQRKLAGLHLFAFGPSTMDADLPLGSLYYSKSTRGYWTSPEVDDLIEKQRGALDEEERKSLISQIWRISQQNVPYIWLYNEIQAYGIRNNIEWKPRPDERLLMQEARLKG